MEAFYKKIRGQVMIELGRLGLGTAPLAGLYEAVDDETAHAVIERAWEHGLRFFDTAPYYGSGLAEERLGEALRHRPRDRFVVSTKVGRLLRPGDSGWPGAPPLEAHFDFSYDAALRSLEESLERLGFDRIDIALVHDPDDRYDEALTGAFRALARLREEGAVRAIGVGMNQVELLGPPDVVARVRELRAVCERHRVPLKAAAVQFPLRHSAVSSVLVGCRTAAEVDEDVQLASLDVPETLWVELA
jgi:aryl-alcohol dehydrogenase-like predicted oxidoreductase